MARADGLPRLGAPGRARRRDGLLVAWAGLAGSSGRPRPGARHQDPDPERPVGGRGPVQADDAPRRHPAPLVVVVPGFQRSKEALASISIELARRGVVVIAIDPYAQGSSSSSASTQAATTEGYGMFAVIDYVANTGNLNYVDKSRIGADGALRRRQRRDPRRRRTSASGRRSPGSRALLNAVFVSGYVLSFTDNVLKDVRSNVGTTYAFYDEGAYRNELKNGDMRRAPEALRLVNSGLGPEAAPLEEVALGQYYWRRRRSGRCASCTTSVSCIRSSRTWSRRRRTRSSTSSASSAWTAACRAATRSGTGRKLLGLIALVAALAGLVPLAQLLLRLPVFLPLVHPVPAPQPRPRGAGRACSGRCSSRGRHRVRHVHPAVGAVAEDSSSPRRTASRPGSSRSG